MIHLSHDDRQLILNAISPMISIWVYIGTTRALDWYTDRLKLKNTKRAMTEEIKDYALNTLSVDLRSNAWCNVEINERKNDSIILIFLNNTGDILRFKIDTFFQTPRTQFDRTSFRDKLVSPCRIKVRGHNDVVATMETVGETDLFKDLLDKRLTRIGLGDYKLSVIGEYVQAKFNNEANSAMFNVYCSDLFEHR